MDALMTQKGEQSCDRESRVEKKKRENNLTQVCRRPRDRSHFLSERETRGAKCSSGSPRKSANVGKVRVKARLKLWLRGRVLVRVREGETVRTCS